MTKTDKDEILARIRERLDATGKTERGASIEAVGHAQAISNIRKGSRPAIDVFEKLAPTLETTPEFLAFGVGKDAEPIVGIPRAVIPVIGAVAAGQWLEVDTAVDAPLYDDVPVPPDPRYPIEHQFAVVVQGTSINRIAPNGSTLGCIDTRKARIRVENEDLVIVEQRRNGGSEIQRTAKVYRLVGNVVELWPESDDPKWTTPLILGPTEGDETVEVEVIGLVTYVHALLRRSGRARRG